MEAEGVRKAQWVGKSSETFKGMQCKPSSRESPCCHNTTSHHLQPSQNPCRLLNKKIIKNSSFPRIGGPLTGNRTQDPAMCRRRSNLSSHTSQGGNVFLHTMLSSFQLSPSWGLDSLWSPPGVFAETSLQRSLLPPLCLVRSASATPPWSPLSSSALWLHSCTFWWVHVCPHETEHLGGRTPFNLTPALRLAHDGHWINLCWRNERKAVG